jgi:rSAM/selenodomain-associated transferase 1
MKRTLGFFARQPEPGRVKTRLAARLSAGLAAQLYEAFLHDLLDRYSTLEVRRVVAFTPEASHPYFQDLVRQRYELVPQVTGDLGTRMTAFFDQEFRSGARNVVLLGTDSPTLPEAHVVQAFTELARCDVVLGPSTDGGYYLIGCARPVPELFVAIDWSTSHVLEQTMVRVRRLGLRLALLPPWYDIDTLEDLACLRGHLDALDYAGLAPPLPNTHAILLKERQPSDTTPR